jgi:hypothetical protein
VSWAPAAAAAAAAVVVVVVEQSGQFLGSGETVKN